MFKIGYLKQGGKKSIQKQERILLKCNSQKKENSSNTGVFLNQFNKENSTMIKLVGTLMTVKHPASWILMFPQTVCLRHVAHDSSGLWPLEAQTSLPPKLHNSLLIEPIALTPSS